jgi:hypothetical protein
VCPIEALPMAVPVNLRSEADPGRRQPIRGVNLAAPIGLHDPEVRIKNIRSQMTRKREERAIDMVGAIAPVLTLMPGQRARVGGRFDRQLRRPGQQCAGSTRAIPSSPGQRSCGSTALARCRVWR